MIYALLTFERLNLFEVDRDATHQRRCWRKGRLSMVCALLLHLGGGDLLRLIHLVGHVDGLRGLRLDDLILKKHKSGQNRSIRETMSQVVTDAVLTILEGISLGSFKSFLVWPDLVLDYDTCMLLTFCFVILFLLCVSCREVFQKFNYSVCSTRLFSLS